MAIARLPVILILVISLLQASQGQQCRLCNNSKLGLGNSITVSSEPLVGVITPQKRNSETCNHCRNNGSTCNTQNTKPLSTGLQQFLTSQQPQQTSANGALNFQPLSVLGSQNSQQQLSIQQQNVQQSIIPSQQSLTPQQVANSQFINQQPAVLQSSNQIQQPCIQLQPSCEQNSKNFQASLNLQPISMGKLTQQPVSQSSKFLSLNNLQAIGQQTLIQKDIDLESLPVINGQVQGLPSQVSQGILLSNLGLQSNLPPSSCTKTSLNQFTPSQNNAVSLTNSPAQLEVSQTAATSYLPDDCAPNKPTQILLMPLSFQSNDVELNPKTLGLTLPLSAFQWQESQNPVNIKSQLPIQFQQDLQGQQPVETLIKTYPIQNQNVQTYAVQNQDIPIQLVQQQATTHNQQLSQVKSVQSQLTSFLPTSIVPDPVPYTQILPMQEQNSVPALNQQMQIPFDGQPNPLTSLLLSLLQPSNSPSNDLNNQVSKPSCIKSLLPLLFNLLNDQNGGCYCPNCNCMNNGQDRQGMNQFMNNPFMQNYINNSPNMVERTEKQEESTTNTYLIYNNTPKTDNEKQNEPKPQITDGYANQIKYGQTIQEDVSQNVVESEETGLSKKAQEKNKTSTIQYQYQNVKKVKDDDSAEYENDDDYGYSYENED